MSDERQTVVIWSGGADSTMLLTEEAHKASRAHPVRALSIDTHPQIHRRLLRSQDRARRRYLKWAKKSGLHIDHATVIVEEAGGAWLQDGATQAALWVAHLAPYLPAKARVLFGYIKHDSFWHHREKHELALKALQELVHADWEIAYPYEWSSKAGIYNALLGWKVPMDCWWTCELPKQIGVECGRCNKCREKRDGMKTAEAKRKEARAKKMVKKR